MARFQAYLDGCARCREEIEGWRGLISDLSTLPELAPTAGFGGRVLDAVGRDGAGRLPLAARVRHWLGARAPIRRTRTPDDSRIYWKEP